MTPVSRIKVSVLLATITLLSGNAALSEEIKPVEKMVTILYVQEDGSLVPAELEARCVYQKPRCAKLSGRFYESNSPGQTMTSPDAVPQK